jgi:hypothetical protein
MTPHDGRNGSARAFLGFLSLALVCLGAAGCGPGDPLDAKVSANDELGLSMWRGDSSRNLTPQQVADLDRALQEFRFHLMATGAASGSKAVEDAMLEAVNGQTLRHVLQQGLGWELDRAESERLTLAASMKTNALMTTRPGDSDSAEYLADLRERQVARLKAATDEVNHARERLAATGMAVPPAPSPAPTQ